MRLLQLQVYDDLEQRWKVFFPLTKRQTYLQVNSIDQLPEPVYGKMFEKSVSYQSEFRYVTVSREKIRICQNYDFGC